MRDFVQYHNPVTREPYEPGPEFNIDASKPVESLLDERVWLVSRYGTPPHFCLCEVFIVEGISHSGGRNIARSKNGEHLDRSVPLNSEPWFPSLKKLTGNFAFGLKEIRDSRIIEGLSRVAARGAQGGKIRVMQRRAGAGFGRMDDNRPVELAAVGAITRMYKARGWDVESKESDCLGYDLLCKAGRKEHHVESKGIRGSICSFPITVREQQAAKVDPAFRLIAVTRALSRDRKLASFTGPELLEKFDFVPTSYVAKPKVKS